MSRRAVPALVLVPLLVVALLVSGSACGTVGSMAGASRPPPVYGGVRVHVEDLTKDWDAPVIAFAAFDLPLSAAADTIVLPVTLVLNVRAWLLRKPAENPD